MRPLAVSIFLHACESWTLTAELEKVTQAFEMRCRLRLFKFCIRTMLPNDEICRKIQAAIGEFDDPDLDGFATFQGLLV